jgi:hypothetical protein
MSESLVESRLTYVRIRWVILFACALTLGYLLAGAHVSPKGIGESDFTSFYGAATLLREGHGAGIYNPALQESMHAALVFPDRIGNLPFVDPPAAAAILVPMTFLPLDVAYHVWGMFEFGVLLLAVLIAVRSAPWPSSTPRRWKYAAVFAAMAGAGTYGVVVEAQWTPFLALGLALAYRQWRSGNLAGGAFVLVLSAGLTKPHLALVLGAFLLGWRDRRLLSGALAGAVTAVLANLVVAGPQGLTGFVHLAVTSQSQWALSTYASFVSLPALLFGHSTATYVVAGVATLVACAVGWWLGNAVRHRSGRLEVALASAAVLSLLAAPHALVHDTSMLAPAAVWMFAWAASRTSTDPVARPSVLAIGAAWFMIAAAGLASVIAVGIPLGWALAATLVAVATLGAIVSLAPVRHTPSVLRIAVPIHQ